MVPRDAAQAEHSHPGGVDCSLLRIPPEVRLSAQTCPATLRTLAAWCERYGVAPYGVTMHLNRQVSVDVTAADMANLRTRPGATYRRSPWTLPGSVFVAQDRVTLDGIEAQYLLTRAELDADRPLLSVSL